MKNAFKTWMENNFPHDELADMANHGANTGYQNLTYNADVIELFNNYTDELFEIMADYTDQTGENIPQYVLENFKDATLFRCAVVHFCAEYVAHEITEGEYV